MGCRCVNKESLTMMWLIMLMIVEVSGDVCQNTVVWIRCLFRMIFRVKLRFILHFFFFFQAEDGIRDYKVTGVQTCALPICVVQSGKSTRSRGFNSGDDNFKRAVVYFSQLPAS